MPAHRLVTESTTFDRLSALLERFRVRAHLFHAGRLCGRSHFAAEPGRAFLHVLRRGEVEITHPPRSGAPPTLTLTEPTILFYPRPIEHRFHSAPEDEGDFVCATLDFDGGSGHPLVRALPALVTLRTDRVAGIEQTLSLLFAETERVRCGQKLLADRLFEILLLQMLRWMLDDPGQSSVRRGLLGGLSHPKLARALTRLHESPGDSWTLDAMAKAAGMSRSAFATEFKHTLGITPGEYLLGWRVSVAQTLLRQGVPVNVISDDVGYTSPAAFSRAFTQLVGVSPRRWRAKPELSEDVGA